MLTKENITNNDPAIEERGEVMDKKNDTKILAKFRNKINICLICVAFVLVCMFITHRILKGAVLINIYA